MLNCGMMRGMHVAPVVKQQLSSPQMQEFTERLGIFITRCRLSDDPAAKAIINKIDVSHLNAGLSMTAMHEGCAISPCCT